MGDEKGQAWALHGLSFSLFQMGRLEEASDANARALAAMRELGDKPGVADGLNAQAIIEWSRGDIAAARESFAQALAAYKALGNDGWDELLCWEISRSWSSEMVRLSRHYAWRARPSRSTHVGRTRRVWRLGYINIAAYRIALGDVDGAREAAREGLRLARQAQHAHTASRSRCSISRCSWRCVEK